MEARAFQRKRRRVAILALGCLAIALWSMSCGGTGTPETHPSLAPDFSLSSTKLDFANQNVGSASSPQLATLTNAGDATLNLSSVQVSGADAGDFTLTDDCGSSLAAQTQCKLFVTFAPKAAGIRMASVVFTDNAPGSPQSLSLNGTGVVSPQVIFSPASLSFGTQGVATTSTVRTITLTNNGEATLSISSLTVSGTNAPDFVEVEDTCGESVPAGATCRIGVTFTPSAAGPREATLNISDNASGSPQAASFTGTGSPDVVLSWGASPSSGVVGYNVYRGTAPGGESSRPLNAMPVSGDSYVDENVIPGATYYYILTAVGADGAQSAPSNETKAVVPTS